MLIAHVFSSPSKVLLGGEWVVHSAGFVGSGPIVLFLEVADQIGPHPLQSQRILLFTVVAFFTFLGISPPQKNSCPLPASTVSHAQPLRVACFEHSPEGLALS